MMVEDLKEKRLEVTERKKQELLHRRESIMQQLVEQDGSFTTSMFSVELKHIYEQV